MARSRASEGETTVGMTIQAKIKLPNKMHFEKMLSHLAARLDKREGEAT
jgi:hypothetical protein